jgi:DNA-binding phage protein
MSKGDVRKAAAMLKDPAVLKSEVAEHFGVSRMTLNESLKREGYPLNPAAEPQTNQITNNTED